MDFLCCWILECRGRIIMSWCKIIVGYKEWVSFFFLILIIFRNIAMKMIVIFTFITLSLLMTIDCLNRCDERKKRKNWIIYYILRKKENAKLFKKKTSRLKKIIYILLFLLLIHLIISLCSHWCLSLSKRWSSLLSKVFCEGKENQ